MGSSNEKKARGRPKKRGRQSQSNKLASSVCGDSYKKLAILSEARGQKKIQRRMADKKLSLESDLDVELKRSRHFVDDGVTLNPVNPEPFGPNENLSIYKQKRIVGEPISQQTKNLDVVAYPELFPYGLGGLDYARSLEKGMSKLSPATFLKFRLQHRDARFRRCQAWQQSGYFLKQDRSICQGIYASTKTGSSLNNLTAAQLAAKCSKDDESVEKDLNMMLQKIKGSKEYWCQKNSDLQAMDNEFGPATFFLTLSCAEKNWPWLEDYIRARNADIVKDRDNLPLGELLTYDRTAVSEFFWRRFQHIMNNIIAPGTASGNPKPGPLGVIEHFFWRLEYQARGAPHVHMKLWVKNAPVLGENGTSEEDVKAFISKYITCEVPSSTRNPKLRRLVLENQKHGKCNSSCFHFKRGKNGRGRAVCRYGFPRRAQDGYSFNGIDDVVKTRHKGKRPKKLYQIPRSKYEVRVNDYNPVILQFWKANMDIQYVGEKSRILNQYVTSYITKGEKKETKDLFNCLRKDSENWSTGSLLRTLAARSTKEREIGIYEILDDLQGHHLHGSSDAVEWLGVGPSHLRSRKILTHEQILKLAEDNPTSTSIFSPNLIDIYYPNRNDDLEDVSLHDIKKGWKFVRRKPGEALDRDPKKWKLNRDCLGWFTKKKSVVVKTRYVPCSKDQAEDFFYSLLQEFVPYRAEEELRAGCKSYAEAFALWVDKIPALKDGKAKRDVIAEGRDLQIRLIEEAHDEAKMEEEQGEEFQEDLDEEIIEPPVVCKTGFRSHPDYQTKEGLAARVAMLGTKQRIAYEEIINTIHHQLQHEEHQCECKEKPQQVLKFISGGAGVGKSRLIETLTEGLEINNQQVLLTAPSGVAAHNIKGITVHRAFHIRPQKSKGVWSYEKLNHVAEKKLYHAIGKAKLIIIDEISMVSSKLLYFIHCRLNDIHRGSGREGDELFGGMNLVVLGDLLQLPPVREAYIFEQFNQDQYRKLRNGAAVLTAPPHLWAKFSYIELTENMRQKDDAAYATLLNRLRIGDTSKDFHLLEARLVQDVDESPISIARILCKLENEGSKPVCLLPCNKAVRDVNAAMLVAKGLKPHFIHATDHCRHLKPCSTKKKLNSKRQKGLEWTDAVADITDYLSAHTNRKTTDAGGMVDVMVLAVGARVMLLKNIDLERGLFNGALGTIKKMVTNEKSPDGINHIVVNFDGLGQEKIERTEGSYFANKVEVKRSQFPLALAYAITIHKSQGLSLDCVVADIGTNIFSAGQAYVALSRVRSLNGLHLLGLVKQNLFCDLKAIAEYNRLRALYTTLAPMNEIPRQNCPISKWNRKRKLLSRPLWSEGVEKHDVPIKTPPVKRRRGRPAKQLDLKVVLPEASRPSALAHGFVPLYNSGNDCFANASIQALLTMEGIQAWASRVDANGDNPESLQYSFAMLVQAQNIGGSTPHTVRNSITAKLCGSSGIDFLNGQQWDSLEYTTILIDSEPYLRHLFLFETKEKITCTGGCGTSLERDTDPSMVLRLRRPIDHRNTVSWKKLLSNALLSQRESNCDHCNAFKRRDRPLNEIHQVEQKLVFRRYLLVQLTRFGQEYEQAPLRLSTTKVSDFNAASTRICGVQWRTMAAVIHHGNSNESGHYWTLTRARDGWIKKDDLISTKQTNFLKQLSFGNNASASYLLLERITETPEAFF